MIVSEYGQAPEAAGAAVASAASATGSTFTRSIAIGVTTGIIVWLVTRWLSSDGRSNYSSTRGGTHGIAAALSD